jgi:hypothetical protein
VDRAKAAVFIPDNRGVIFLEAGSDFIEAKSGGL